MLTNYLKLAWRVLLRRKFYTFVSIFGIAFTLLVLTVATTLLDQSLSPLPPETDADRCLYLVRMQLSGPHITRTQGAGYAFLDSQVRTLPGAERVAIVGDREEVVTYVGGRRIESTMRRADAEYWRLLHFDFVEGGPFTAADDHDGRRVAVISETTRDRVFGGGPAAGRTFEIDGEAFQVCGVVRDVPPTRLVAGGDIWAPIGSYKDDSYRKEVLGAFTGIVLARDRADFPKLQAEFRERVPRYPLPDPKVYESMTAEIDTLFHIGAEQVLGDQFGGALESVARGLIALAAVLFMLLPAINLVNLNLSRILERASEIGVRKAFGATSRTLVGQFVVENVILTLLGGAIAWALAAVVLAAINVSGLVPDVQLQLNLRVLGWGVLTAIFFGIFSGVYPAWRMSRLHPVEALRGRFA